MNFISFLISKWYQFKANNVANSPPKNTVPVSKSIDANLEIVTNIIGDDDSRAIGKVDIAGGKIEVGLVYLKGLADEESISRQIIARLTEYPFPGESLSNFRLSEFATG